VKSSVIPGDVSKARSTRLEAIGWYGPLAMPL